MQIQKNINKPSVKNKTSAKKGLGKPNANTSPKKKKQEDDIEYTSYDEDGDDVFDADDGILEEEDTIDSTSVASKNLLGKFSTNHIIIAVVAVILIVGLMSLVGGNKDSNNSADTPVAEETETSTDTDSNNSDSLDDSSDSDSLDNSDYVNNSDTFSDDSDDDGIADAITEEPVYDVDLDSSEAINPGWYANDNTTSATVYSSTDTLKDLNGVDIPAVFTVKDIATVTEYVNYEKRRAVMDEGLELYWVEIVYSNKKYRTTIPFNVFRQLNNDGICKVEMEVLTLEGGEKVVSYMEVVI